MSRWLAGIFDPRAGAGAGEPLAAALTPHRANVLARGPLRVAFSGSAPISTAPICLFDGHLDNGAEIAAALAAGEQLSGAPEALLALAYRRWGPGLPERMRGDFVLVVWDEERGEGIVARDQLGARPLFLHEAGGKLTFANEIRHLLPLLPRRPGPDPASVSHWIALSGQPQTRTLYEGVRRLGPGTMLVLDRDGPRRERYWAPRYEDPLDLPAAALAEPVREGLERAVSRRIGANGATGVTMSGGLDSSSIAAIGAALAPGRIYACSARFPEHPEADESALIDELRGTLALPAIAARVRPGGLLAALFDHLSTWRVPPIAWGDPWALALLREAGARGVETMLGGDGGDELFAARYYLLADTLRAGHPLRALTLARELPGGGPGAPRREVARVAASLGVVGALPHGLHSMALGLQVRRDAPGWMRRRALRDLIGSDDRLAWKELDGPRWWAHAAHGLSHGIEAAGVFEHLRRRAALCGLESRHPMLDLDLVELALRLPPRATFDRRFNRPVLRVALDGLLPDSVRLRPGKAWFHSLIVDCLTGSDWALLHRLLADPGAELGAYVDLKAMRATLLDSERRRRENPFRWMWQVWRLLTLECWLRAEARPAEIASIGRLASPPRVEIDPPTQLVPFST